MNEQLGEPTEPNEPAIPARYENEVVPEQVIHRMRYAGMELYERSFPDLDAAKKAGRQFFEEWMAEAELHEEFKTLILRAEGDDMYVSNTSYSDDHDGNISIQYSNDPLLVPLRPMSTRLFQFRGLYPQIRQQDAGEGYEILPYIVGNDIITTRQTRDTRLGFPLVSIQYNTTVMVPCMNMAEIESYNLYHERRRVNAMQNLAEYAEHYPDIMNDLAQIDRELFESKGRSKELHSVSALRELGRVGIEFSLLSSKHEDALNTAIVTTIGEGKPLTIDGNIYSLTDANELERHATNAFRGRLVTVITTTPAHSDNKGQTLAMMPLSPSEGKGTYYAPLSEINSVRF